MGFDNWLAQVEAHLRPHNLQLLLDASVPQPRAGTPTLGYGPLTPNKSRTGWLVALGQASPMRPNGGVTVSCLQNFFMEELKAYVKGEGHGAMTSSYFSLMDHNRNDYDSTTLFIKVS
jgi:hypothetical protein